jgi:integrase
MSAMLTDAAIQRAIKKGIDTQLSDGSGKGTGRLLLIIRNTGNRITSNWYAQQWLSGKKRLLKLGTYPVLTLAEARRRFHEDFGIAIQAKRNIKFVRSDKPGTLQELFIGYVDQLKARNKRSFDDAEYNLNRLLLSLDGSMLARDVRADHITELLRPIYSAGTKSMADHMRSYVHSAFAWGIKSERDYRQDIPKRFFIDANPAADIPSEPKTPGTRWLSVDELRTFWRWLHVLEPYNPRACAPVLETNLKALRLVLLTGQRVEMITELHRDMYRDGCIEWSTTKNGLPHVLPLPRQAVELLADTPPNKNGWYFPRLTEPSQHVTHNLLLSIVYRFAQRTGTPHFATRDLRRTWKTLAGQAGISKDDRDRLQHHARHDVSSRHYDRYEYLDEKRAAMDRWSEWFAKNIEA